MKIIFFAIIDPNWTKILASKGSNMEFIKQKDQNYIITNYVTL